jgi:hypothetical protein
MILDNFVPDDHDEPFKNSNHATTFLLLKWFISRQIKDNLNAC